MKKGWSWMYVLLLVLVANLAGCGGGGKQSSIEGKLVDWDGKPVAGVKIIATQAQPIKGYEQFETVTGSDGIFQFKSLFPSSKYVLKPWSDKWTCETTVEVISAPQGETAMFPEPMIIANAYAKNGSRVVDLVTGATRFAVSSEGVITDSITGLEWVVGSDETYNYNEAEQWVASCSIGGGKWRMPTREELKGLYLQGVGKNNLDPAFRTTNLYIWAEPKDSTSAYLVLFLNGEESFGNRWISNGARVFGVRSRQRS